MHEVGPPGQSGGEVDEISDALLPHQTAHHHDEWTRCIDHRVHRGEKPVEDDAVADEVHLAGRADVGTREHGFVLATLDQHPVRPGAAPPLEAPAEDVGDPTVFGKVPCPVDGVDGDAAGQTGRRQTHERCLGGVGLYDVEASTAQVAPQVYKGHQVGPGEHTTHRNHHRVCSLDRVVKGVARHHRPVNFRQRPQLVGQDDPGGERGGHDPTHPQWSV